MSNNENQEKDPIAMMLLDLTVRITNLENLLMESKIIDKKDFEKGLINLSNQIMAKAVEEVNKQSKGV